MWGEENPTEGETPISWLEWSDGSGGTPAVDNWGNLCLGPASTAQSRVEHTSNGSSKNYTIELSRYQANPSVSGSFDIYIRGSATVFSQDDGESPTWELYTGLVEKDWQYFQVRLVGK